MPVPPKTFVPGSQAPAWEPHCRQSSCFARESSIYCAMRPKQELGGNLRSQAGAWERGKGGMHCAFPPYGLQAFPPYGLLMKRSVGRASPPTVAMSSWCVRRTLRKTFGTEIIAGAPSRLSRPDTGLLSTRYPVHHKPGRLRPSMGIAGDCKPPAWIIRRKWRQNLLR